MTDKFYARPVIPLLLSMVWGIALGSRFPGHKAGAYLLISLCLAFILYIIIKKKDVLTSPLILFFALGYLSIQSWVAPGFPPHHIIHFTDTQPRKIVGIIDDNPVVSGSRLKFVMRIKTLGDNNPSSKVTGNIRVTVPENDLQLSRGDQVVIFSRIRSIRNFNNPGGFDYKKYMAFKKVSGTAYVSPKRIKLLKRNSEKDLYQMVTEARKKISDLIDLSVPEKQRGVLKALIIGDRNAISKDLREAFNKAGLGHLLAISGLHIGIIAAAAFLFFQWILSHIQFFLWKAWTQKGAVILSLVPVLIYGLLSGMSPSTQRAVIMVIVFLMTFLFEREQDLMNTLALAAMLILVIHPPSLFSISFQLSFSAVCAIIYGMSRTQNLWPYPAHGEKQPRHLPVFKKIFFFFLASFFAILGTLPLIMLYFNQISLVGLLTNFLIIPPIGFVVVPLGLLAVFLYPVTVSGASMCLNLGAAVLSLTLDIVNFFANLPFASIKTVTPTYFEICCFYVLFWAGLNLKIPHHRSIEGPDKVQIVKRLKQPEPHGKEQKSWVARQKFAAIIAAVVILALGADALYWLNQRLWHDDLRVTMLDVGQGSSALLELPGGHCLLIDGGGFSDNSVFDVGARILAPFLWRKKIKTVDTLILSHPNSDHLNGLMYIAEHFNVKSIWTNNQAANTSSYQKFLKTTDKMKIRMPRFNDLPRTINIKGVALTVLYPPVDFPDKSKKEQWRTINNNSLVIKVAFGSQSFLFPGDIRARAEGELVSIAKDNLQSTVLISPHHGSKSSSTVSFLDTVDPEWVIISSGWKNRFGFPHQQVLRRYRERGYKVFRTDRQGAITLSTDGQSLTIKSTIIDDPKRP